ncbi:MAG TPA: glycogen debranching protein, partial [Candidatus Dormibacteraeota bacterium]|nr:glycogen debranching protein [Candidatus Dormibacteraeota bacterium]
MLERYGWLNLWGRRQRCVLRIALIAAIVEVAVFAGARSGSEPAAAGSVAPPALSFADAKTEESIGVAYNDAVKNLLEINTVPYDRAEYNRSGLLYDRSGTFIRAGGGYAQPWTRDASVNSWNAASMIEPEAARNTLWAVVDRQVDGGLIVQQDNQWWDQTIWVIAAWNHFLVTGDRAFLAKAYETARHTLSGLRKNHYNAAMGLFEGPSFFNDGIAGYPVPPATPKEDRGSFVLDYPGADKVIALSTNCIYYEAYRRAAEMGKALSKAATEIEEFNAMGQSLKAAINAKFWNARTGLYGYLLIDGVLSQAEEGAGLSFAILFDIAGAAKAESILKNAHVQAHGIVDVYPNFPRYSDAHPGRHNQMVWPMVEGFWADAAARSRDEQVFAREASNLA